MALYSFRRRLKKELPGDDHVFSVQTDINSDGQNETEVEAEAEADPRILFRIVIQKCSRKAKRDERTLLFKAPMFLVFYPGEPYIYADRPILDHVIYQVKLNLDWHIISMPFSGRNIKLFYRLGAENFKYINRPT